MADTLFQSSSTNNNDNTSTQNSHHFLDFPALAKSLNFDIPIKLDRKNFVNWRAQALSAIRALELDNYISSEFTPPPQLVIGSTGINPYYRSWHRSDQLLLCWLLSTIGEEVIGQVNQSQTSIEAWQILEKLYAQT